MHVTTRRLVRPFLARPLAQTLTRLAGATILLLSLAHRSEAEIRPQGGVSGTESGFAVVGVDVIPMDRDQVLENQTVIVIDGRITSVGGADETSVPDGLSRIDGRRRYLMPGLVDLHVHVRRPDEYLSYLAYGVTTVMHLGGSATRGRQLLEDRRQITAGELLGPNIYATERVLDGDPPVASGAYSLASPEEARRTVAELAAAGFDFVKIYNNVSLPVFTAIVDEARKHGLPVFGHVPRGFDPLAAMREGQNAVVHTEEFFFTYFDGPRSTTEMDRSYVADRSKIPALVDVVFANDVAIMPDLSFTFTNLLMWDSLDHLWMDAELSYQHPNTVSDWRSFNINRREEIENFVVRGQWKYELLQELTRQFQQAGILQVIGTDASLPGLFPGKAAHRELTELVKAGLSNFDALSIGTRNAGEFVARYIDEKARFGRIEPGYRADMVLVGENPLADVRHARLVEAVAVNGRWVERAELDRQRSALATRYRTLTEVGEQVDAALADNGQGAAVRTVLSAHADDGEIAATIEQRINSTGYAAAAAGELERARRILEIGTELFPTSANAWDSLAEIALMQGDRRKSIEYYRKALEVDPDFTNAVEQLEKILAEGPV